ncbi:MAG: MFS transporter [Eubacteriales bacterium]|nr:MFS transporter [Eubacteriales bacterium]
MDKKQTARLMLAATFLLWFSVYTYPSFLSAYAQEELMASAVMIGAITGSYGFTQMLLRIPLGLWSDIKKTRKPFLVAGAAASVVAALGLMLCRNQVGALIFRGMSGVAASTWVAYSVMYSSCFDHEDTGAAMSRLSFYQYGSQVAAMILGAFLADKVGKWASFALAAAAGVAGVCVTLRIRDLPPQGERQTVRDFLSVLRDRRLLCGTALSTIFHFVCWGTVLGFTVNWAKGVIGLTTSQLGFLSAAYLVPNAICARATGALEKKISRRFLLTGGFAIVAAASFLYGTTATPVQLFLVQMLFGCGMGLIIPMTMADAIANIPDSRRSAAMGFYQSIYGVGMFLGPMIAGAVVEACKIGENLVPGYHANFTLMALVSIAGGVLAFLVSGEKKRKQS